MFKSFLYRHYKSNLKNFIISNFIFLNKKIKLKNKIKLFFFFNNYNFYLSLFILFNFWIQNYLMFFLNKNKIILILNKITFFTIFSLFFYPYLINTKFFLHKINKFIYFTFLINRFFFNPLLLFFNNLNLISLEKTFNILKASIILKKNQFFFLTFYFNFFQIPLFFLKK